MTSGQRILDSNEDDAPQTQAEQLADAVVVSSVSRLMGGNPPPVRLGRFALVRLLGRGGAGTVYQASDAEQDRQVALKVLHGTPQHAAESEHGALADLRHPSLVRHHGRHCIDGLQCVSMELVSGDTLSDWVSRSNRCTGQVEDIVRQLTNTLVFLHNHGITHGDIKSSNIMVAADGRVILLDFGLASVAAPGERVRRRGQTAGYTPEDSVEQRASDDWYALGCLLSRLLDGSRETDKDPTDAFNLRRLAHALKGHAHTDRSAQAEVAHALDLRSEPKAPSRFVGRAAERMKLATWLSPSSTTPVTLLAGESGIGKTALARTVLEDVVCHDPLVRVFSARSYPRSSALLNTLDSLAESICTFVDLQPNETQAFYVPQYRNELATVLPAFGRLPALSQATAPSDEQEVMHRAGLALHELLARIGTSEAVIVWIDDAQWLEDGAWQVLATLFQKGVPAGTRVLLSTRTEDSATTLLRERLESYGVSTNALTLAGLEPEQARTLVETSGRFHAPERVERLVQNSAGHPLFLEELLSWSDTREDSSPSLHDMIRDRVENLGLRSQQLLQLLAISHGPVDQRVLKSVTGKQSLAVSTLIQERLVRRSSGRGECLDVYHDQVRAAVLSNLDDEQREALHLKLARALEADAQANSDAGTIAFHFWKSGRLSDARTWLERAAAAAEARLDFPESATLHRAAIRLVEDEASKQASLVALAEAERASGRSEVAAERFFEAASGSTSASQRVYLQRMGIGELLRAGKTKAALPHMMLLLRQLRVPFPTSRTLLMVRTLWLMCLLRLFGLKRNGSHRRKEPDTVHVDVCGSISLGVSQTDMLLAAYFAMLTSWRARQTGDASRVAHAMARSANVRSLMSPFSQGARDAIDTTRVEAIRLKDPYAETLVLLASAHASLNRAEWTQALELGLAAEKRLQEECTGVPYDLLAAHTAIANAMDFLGMVLPYKERVTRLRAEATRRGNHVLALTMAADEHRCFLFDDQPDEARNILDTTLRKWPGEGFVLPHTIVYLGHVWIDLYQQKLESALDKALHANRLVRSQMGHKMTLLRIQMDGTVGRAAAAVFLSRGCTKALRLARSAARRLRKEDGRLGPGYAALITGLVSFRDRPATARSHLEEAAATFDALSMRHWAASTRWARSSLDGTLSDELNQLAVDGVVCPQRLAKIYAPTGGPA